MHIIFTYVMRIDGSASERQWPGQNKKYLQSIEDTTDSR